ncbi:MAG TPA: hypothetical protein VHA76_01435 [Solirubrobacterales bacterium]|nr:hypothetical protein [Solirubrobacterales bacterium]
MLGHAFLGFAFVIATVTSPVSVSGAVAWRRFLLWVQPDGENPPWDDGVDLIYGFAPVGY